MATRSTPRPTRTRMVATHRLRRVTNSDARLRAECARIIATLHPPQPRDRMAHWDITDCIAHVAALRGRPIVRVAMGLPASWPCGLVLSTARYDMIIRPPGDTVLARHTELHQLGHLIVDRSPEPAAHADPDTYDPDSLRVLRALMPDLPIGMLLQLLGRTTATDPDERRAETLASMLGGLLAEFQDRSRRNGDRARPPTHARPDVFVPPSPHAMGA